MARHDATHVILKKTDATDPLLALAVAAAREAGALLREEFHRPDGPRGAGESAVVDREAELLIRARLLGRTSRFGFLGEETGASPGEGAVWVVDPNDGTRDFLRGMRGSAVSIALVRDGAPVLGVVYSPLAPDDDGNLMMWAMWAEGEPTPRREDTHRLLLVSPQAEARGTEYSKRLHPWRFQPSLSVAYRLALVAKGDATAAVGLRGPRDWDYAGAHALLRGAGLSLVDQEGADVQYGPDGSSRTDIVLGGAPSAIEDLVARDWSSPAGEAEALPFVLPEPGRAIRDAAPLRRAQGCLLGQVVGDALGSLVEFRTPNEIRRRYPQGVRDLADGGTWSTIAGQPTDDSELALALARSLARQGEYVRDDVFRAYRNWYESEPFDVGGTTRRAFSGAGTALESQANGSLMRMSPLGIFGWRKSAAELARLDSSLSHPHPTCQDACAVLVVAISHAVRHGDPQGAFESARAEARTDAVTAALDRAETAPPEDFLTQQGWVLIALQNAFYRLLHAPSLETALVETVGAGGDTDTNAAIAGSLLGAVHGREAIPLR